MIFCIDTNYIPDFTTILVWNYFDRGGVQLNLGTTTATLVRV